MLWLVIGYWILLFVLLALSSVNSYLQGWLCACGLIFTHVVVVVVGILNARPLGFRKKKQPSPNSVFEIPPHVVRMSIWATGLPPNWQRAHPITKSLLGIPIIDSLIFGFGILFFGVFTIWIWIGLLPFTQSESYAVYSNGIPLTVTLEAVCEQEFNSTNQKVVGYYRNFYYTTPYDRASATQHTGRYGLEEAECKTLPTGTPIMISYLSEKPDVYRVIAGAYQSYDVTRVTQLRALEVAGMYVIGFATNLFLVVPPLLLAGSIFEILRRHFLWQNGEIILGAVYDVTTTRVRAKAGSPDQDGLDIKFRYYFYRPDGTAFWNVYRYSMRVNSRTRQVSAGDQIAILYVDDQYYRLL
jgi:hypothetical protein